MILPDYMIREGAATGGIGDGPHMPIKTCSKCHVAFPANAENFYRHPGGRYKLTPRCKPCVNEDNALNEARRRERDPEGMKAKSRARSNRYYRENIEVARAYCRKSAAKARQDPERRALINMRKRAAGARMTPEAFAALLVAQGGVCAICGTGEPESRTGSQGWNIDHCHKTRSVRFILCGPCNRGLGAFCDDPIRMRKAADLIEAYTASAPEGRA